MGRPDRLSRQLRTGIHAPQESFNFRRSLIYVNPKGPNDNPDSIAAAVGIRETFGRIAMNEV